MVTAAEFRVQQAEKMAEAELQEKARIHAKSFKPFGMIYYHTWTSVNSPAGMPDAHFVMPHVGEMWREMKRACSCTPTRKKSCKAHLSPAQVDYLLALETLGRDVGIWTPIDYYDGRLPREVQALSKRGWEPSVGHLYVYRCICGSEHLGDRRSAGSARPADRTAA